MMFDYFVYHLKKLAWMGLFLFVLLMGLFAILFVDFRRREALTSPSLVFDYVMKHDETGRYFSDINRKYLEEKDIWAIYIDPQGRVRESVRKPKNIQTQFNLQDVARFSRFYLEDYPVFTYVAGEGLMVFGFPKNSFDKLPANYYNFDNLMNNVKLFMLLLLASLGMIYGLYRHEIKNFKKQLRPLERGIDHLYDRDFAPIKEDYGLKALAEAINQANRRYVRLSQSRAKWIRGISHDIRTPLAKVNWQLEKIKTTAYGDMAREMEKEIMWISRLVEDLNLTMRLETLGREQMKIESPLGSLRTVVIDGINQHPDRQITFNQRLASDTMIQMNTHLFQRMLKNILDNALIHTAGDIQVVVEAVEDVMIIRIIDEGDGIDDDIIRRLQIRDMHDIQTHGLGLFIAKQIAELHGGDMMIQSTEAGSEVSFLFSIEKRK